MTPTEPTLTRRERREKAAGDALRTLIRDLYVDRFGKEPVGERTVPLNLALTCTTGASWAISFTPPIYDQLGTQLEDLEAGFNRFVPGHVYNYCEECSTAPECSPPTQWSVFSGYDSKGIPQWHDFSQTLLDARDERTALLYEKNPPILAVLQYGRDLHEQQLRSYGRTSKTYSILAQVTAGYFQQPIKHTSTADPRLALTFQVVETRDQQGAFKLELNVLSAIPKSVLQEWFAHDWCPGIPRALQLARRDLAKLERQVLAARRNRDIRQAHSLLRRIPAIMKSLRISLERADRQDNRRTRHAVTRKKQQRPIHKAQEDLKKCATDRFFFDEKHHTWVVVGSGNRAHAFNDEGRHITSFSIQADSVDFRLRTHRWRRSTLEELTLLKDHAIGS